MPRELFTNVGHTKVAGLLTTNQVTMSVTPGTGVVLPSPTGGDFFRMLLVSPSTGNMEVVRCTARIIDTLTIERALEPVWGRPAEAFQFEDGDEVMNSPSAEFYESLARADDVTAEITRLDAGLTQEINDRAAGDAALDTAKADKSAVDAAVAALEASKADRTELAADIATAGTATAANLLLKADKAVVDPKLEALRNAVNNNTQARLNYVPPPELPAGTRMLFHQSSPPPGWAKVNDYDDHALRITTGAVFTRSTGTTGSNTSRQYSSSSRGMSAVFGAGGHTEYYTMTTADLPRHTHSVGSLTVTGGGHRHREGGIHFQSSTQASGINHAGTVQDGITDGLVLGATGRDLIRGDGVRTNNMVRFLTDEENATAFNQIPPRTTSGTGSTTVGGHVHDVDGRTGDHVSVSGASTPTPQHRHDMDLEVNYTSVILCAKSAITSPTVVPITANAPFVTF